ncbi:MAG: substrate-binding domain-containing protein, partial [Gammaproteobacteria bacterium]|nr:substrate-binding domain-containing protein [Gammaproteobacteria bacterium]
TNASRAIKLSEVESCAKNGVTEIVEVKIGYDGIVVANAKQAEQLALSRKDIFMALAKDVPDPNGSEKLVANPYKTWNEVDSTLPDTKIEVLGPPPTSGTRDAFVELAMEGGCQAFDFIKAMKRSDERMYQGVCHTIREDGAFIEAGENDNLIVQKLAANPAALGIFGFSFLDQNSDKVQGAKIDGIEPTFEAIADGTYPISRPLFFYVKRAHLGKVPGIEAFLAEFTSEKAWGEEGYLVDKGMIPMPPAERERFAANVKMLYSLEK